MNARAWTEGALFLLALTAIQGLAAAQSMRYLHDFVTFPQPPGVLYGTALVAGALIGWAARNARMMLLAPLGVALGAGCVFFVVAWSPVWLGSSRHDIAVVNELLRQGTLAAVLTLVPIYAGSIGGFFVRQARG